MTASTAKTSFFTTKMIAKIGILSAVAFVLMLIEFPLPFIAPPFYKLDLSEISVMIGGFALGPWACVIIEALKIVLKLLFKPTTTVFVGELANFIVGCALTVPAALYYRKHKTIRGAVTGMIIGTLTLIIVGFLANYVVLLPFYSYLYKTPIDVFVSMGTAIFPFVQSEFGLLLFCVVPFNLLKGVMVSVVTMLLYKHVSPLLHR